MGRSALGTGDLFAIAIGGVLGATVRRGVLSIRSSEWSADWFAYARNATPRVEPNINGVEQSTSELPIAIATDTPWDTLAVNLAGCLLLGALTLMLARSTNVSRRFLVGAATGFCGSLTTFSTFALEVATRLRARVPRSEETAGLDIRIERDVASLGLYLALSIAGGAIAFWLGRLIAKRIVTSPGDVTIGGTS